MKNNLSAEQICEICGEPAIGICYQKWACKKHFEQRSREVRKEMGLPEVNGGERIVIEEFPGQKVDWHLRTFGHLPSYSECDDSGSCLDAHPELRKDTPHD